MPCARRLPVHDRHNSFSGSETVNLDTTNPPPKLLIKGLGKRYGDITALEPTDLVVNTG